MDGWHYLYVFKGYSALMSGACKQEGFSAQRHTPEPLEAECWSTTESDVFRLILISSRKMLYAHLVMLACNDVSSHYDDLLALWIVQVIEVVI